MKKLALLRNATLAVLLTSIASIPFLINAQEVQLQSSNNEKSLELHSSKATSWPGPL